MTSSFSLVSNCRGSCLTEGGVNSLAEELELIFYGFVNHADEDQVPAEEEHQETLPLRVGNADRKDKERYMKTRHTLDKLVISFQ